MSLMVCGLVCLFVLFSNSLLYQKKLHTFVLFFISSVNVNLF